MLMGHLDQQLVPHPLLVLLVPHLTATQLTLHSRVPATCLQVTKGSAAATVWCQTVGTLLLKCCKESSPVCLLLVLDPADFVWAALLRKQSGCLLLTSLLSVTRVHLQQAADAVADMTLSQIADSYMVCAINRFCSM